MASTRSAERSSARGWDGLWRNIAAQDWKSIAQDVFRWLTGICIFFVVGMALMYGFLSFAYSDIGGERIVLAASKADAHFETIQALEAANVVAATAARELARAGGDDVQLRETLRAADKEAERVRDIAKTAAAGGPDPGGLSLSEVTAIFTVLILTPVLAALLLTGLATYSICSILDFFHVTLLKRLQSINRNENRKAEQHEGQQLKEHLDWSEVVSFLITENFNAIVSQLQRLDLMQAVTVGSDLAPTQARRQLEKVIGVLQQVARAISEAGTKYDAEHDFSVSDDLPAIRKRIGLLERFLQYLHILALLRLLIALTVPVLTFWLVASVMSRDIDLGLDWLLNLGDGPSPLAAWDIPDFTWMVLQASVCVVLFFGLIEVVALLTMIVMPTRSQLLRRSTSTFIILLIVGGGYGFGAVDLLNTAALSASNTTSVQLWQMADFSLRALRPGGDVEVYLGDLTASQRFFTRVLAAGALCALVAVGARLLAATYEFTARRRGATGISLPPDLLQIAGSFVVFVLFTLLVYTAGIEYIRVEGGGGSSRGAPTVSGLEDFLPYSVFLALVGAIMAVATKDLLENYFAGLSLRVDSPFDVGDRVSLNGGPALEAQRIGVRAVEFFDIHANSRLSVSHRELAAMDLRNYTKREVAYRRDVVMEMVIPSDRAEHDVLAELEGALLLAAFAAPGVRTPQLGPHRIFFEQTHTAIVISGEGAKGSKKPVADAPLQPISSGTRGSQVRLQPNGDPFSASTRRAVVLNQQEIETAGRRGHTVSADYWMGLVWLNRQRGGALFDHLLVGKVIEALREMESTISGRAARRSMDRNRDQNKDKKDRAAAIRLTKDAHEDVGGKPHVSGPALRDQQDVDALSESSAPQAYSYFGSVYDGVQAQIFRIMVLVARLEEKINEATPVGDTAPPNPPLPPRQKRETSNWFSRWPKWIEGILIGAEAEQDEKSEDGAKWEAQRFAEDAIRFPGSDPQKMDRLAAMGRECADDARAIAAAFGHISVLLWRLRDAGGRQISGGLRRDIERASLSLLDAPHVASQRLITDQGTAYWRVTLNVTIGSAEKADETLNQVNLIAARLLDESRQRRSEPAEEPAEPPLALEPEA